MIKLITTTALALFSANALGAQITCNIASAVNRISQPDHKITIELDSDKQNCEKTLTYTVPNSSVDVTVHGHGDCNPAPDFCSNEAPTIGGIEAHDRIGNNYSKTYGACEKPIEHVSLQMISSANQRVNVVVVCNLIK